MSSLFQEMEEFTLLDGLVPSSSLLDCSPADDDQFTSGLLFPGDSLVKNDVGPADLFDDLLSGSAETLEDPFSQEWMETVDLSCLIDETPNNQSEISKSTGSSRLLEELLTKPIKIKSSPTVLQSQLDSKTENVNSNEILQQEIVEQTSHTPSILEQAVNEIEGLDALELHQGLSEIYSSISDSSAEISLIDSSNEFLSSSPLSFEDIDSILSSPQPSSPSNSIQDDPDYEPSVFKEKRSKRQCKSKSSKKTKIESSPYEIPTEKMDKKERKRIQNRNAAIRYREKKRAERGTIHSEEDVLAAKNKELKSKVEHLSNEINYMKTLLTEVCEARGLKIQFK